MVFWALKNFDQLPKKNLQILAVDQKFKLTQNDINKSFDQLPKRTHGFWQLIKSSNNGILGFKKVSINCQKRRIFSVDQIFRSTD
jgi:hypothetical protein